MEPSDTDYTISEVDALLQERAVPIAPDPLGLRRFHTPPASIATLRRSGKRALADFYERQNAEIVELLYAGCVPGDDQNDAAAAVAHEQRGAAVRAAVWGSLAANVVLLALQLYVAISSASMALFATCADAFMDLWVQLCLWAFFC